VIVQMETGGTLIEIGIVIQGRLNDLVASLGLAHDA